MNVNDKMTYEEIVDIMMVEYDPGARCEHVLIHFHTLGLKAHMKKEDIMDYQKGLRSSTHSIQERAPQYC